MLMVIDRASRVLAVECWEKARVCRELAGRSEGAKRAGLLREVAAWRYRAQYHRHGSQGRWWGWGPTREALAELALGGHGWGTSVRQGF